jgi:8-oxo-dGTP pyrophosphatase MutT (NUDIX family)
MNSIEQIKQQIQLLPSDTHQPADDQLINAAVMILLHEQDQQAHILLTERAAHLRNHAGQISFPGGRYELEDKDLVTTALRETHEELGIEPSAITLLGSIQSFETLTGYRIYPYMGVLEQMPELVIDAGEVASAFSAPTQLLFDRQQYTKQSIDINGVEREFYGLDYQEHTIWGATAAILMSLANNITD